MFSKFSICLLISLSSPVFAYQAETKKVYEVDGVTFFQSPSDQVRYLKRTVTNIYPEGESTTTSGGAVELWKLVTVWDDDHERIDQAREKVKQEVPEWADKPSIFLRLPSQRCKFMVDHPNIKVLGGERNESANIDAYHCVLRIATRNNGKAILDEAKANGDKIVDAGIEEVKLFEYETTNLAPFNPVAQTLDTIVGNERLNREQMLFSIGFALAKNQDEESANIQELFSNPRNLSQALTALSKQLCYEEEDGKLSLRRIPIENNLYYKKEVKTHVINL